ncbi:hypothetical protein MAR_027457 [Mya arenaria]|uniref:Uncharacterized protein n=1 Tax=Mya arenaria TaxID=6604 RepID=A0ABY7EVK5_MYAAR|nr:hypothetical protein MAR_027457 [Mya arenaria]
MLDDDDADSMHSGDHDADKNYPAGDTRQGQPVPPNPYRNGGYNPSTFQRDQSRDNTQQGPAQPRFPYPQNVPVTPNEPSFSEYYFLPILRVKVVTISQAVEDSHCKPSMSVLQNWSPPEIMTQQLNDPSMSYIIQLFQESNSRPAWEKVNGKSTVVKTLWRIWDRLELATGYLVRTWRLYDLHAKKRHLQTGTAVWLYDNSRRHGICSKLSSAWKGPYLVVAKLDDLVYMVKRSPKLPAKPVHIDRLMKYHSPPNSQPPTVLRVVCPLCISGKPREFKRCGDLRFHLRNKHMDVMNSMPSET